jgi:hypothetical protein
MLLLVANFEEKQNPKPKDSRQPSPSEHSRGLPPASDYISVEKFYRDFAWEGLYFNSEIPTITEFERGYLFSRDGAFRV